MEEFNHEPFVCVEVNEFNNPVLLAKRLEEFFPKRIVRLKINGKFSPFFYLGSNLWVYNNFSKKCEFNYKFCTEETTDDLFNEEIVDVLNFFDIKYENLKLLTNLIVKNEELRGYFFSDGTHHIFDQFIFENCDKVRTLFEKYLKAKIVIDLTNTNEEGFIILKTNLNIFGEINDKSNTTK